MHIVKQSQLLSFLDWNRTQGREFSDLVLLGEADRSRYDEIVASYAKAVGIEKNSRAFDEVRSSTLFAAMINQSGKSPGSATKIDFVYPSMGQDLLHHSTSPLVDAGQLNSYDMSARYEAIPNRVYLFMTGLDGTLSSVIFGSLKELSRLTGDHLDIAVPCPASDEQSEYELFSSMYMYQKCGANRADLPFFLLYSSKGFVRIENHQGHFDVYYLRQLFRALPDEFDQVEGPATQKQLDAIAKNLRSLSASPQATQPQPVKKSRIRWGWIVTLVSLSAGLSTILANFDRAKTTACGLLDRVGLEVCVGSED